MVNKSTDVKEDGTIKRPPVVKKTTHAGVFISLTVDTRHSQFKVGEVTDVPLAVRVAYDTGKLYLRTGITFGTYEKYISFVKANDTRADKKDHVAYYNMVIDVVKKIITTSKGQFSLNRLKDELKKGANADKDLFAIWEAFTDTKEKIKTREMYEMALRHFRKFADEKKLTKKDKSGRYILDIRTVTTETIASFSEWLITQKSGVVKKGQEPTKPLSLDTRMIILRATRAVFNQAQKNGRIDKAPLFTIHKGNRNPHKFLSVEDVLKLWQYWTNLDENGKRSASGAAVGRWLMLYCLDGMNAIDMSKLKWNKESNVTEPYPHFIFTRSKINRQNQDAGKKLNEIVVPIIPELRTLLDWYASPFECNAPVFPNVFGNASVIKEDAIKVHDYCRRITKNIAPICDALGIERVTTSYCRNSFATALSHNGTIPSYIDYCLGHESQGVSELLAGYLGKLTPKAMYEYNKRIFTIPTLPGNDD